MPETSNGNWSASQSNTARIPVMALGISLSIFLGLTFILCVIFGLLFPAHPMYPAWSPFLPGFTWLSWPSFFIGFIEALAYGWYAALIFAPIYNYLAAR